MSRYEIREQTPTLAQEGYGVARKAFLVWDTERDVCVPAGSYRTAARAKERIQRLEAREVTL